jgi:hypothetical protein
MSESFHVNFSFSGQVVLQEKILEIFFLYTVSPIMASPHPPGSWFLQTWFCTVIKLSCKLFLQTWFCTMLLSFHVNFSFSGTVVLLQKIFEKCFLHKHHLRKPSVRFSHTLISPLAEFTYFLSLQIVVLWVLQAPIRSRLTDMFILLLASMASLPCHLCHGILHRKERRTISSVAVGVYFFNLFFFFFKVYICLFPRPKL